MKHGSNVGEQVQDAQRGACETPAPFSGKAAEVGKPNGNVYLFNPWDFCLFNLRYK